MHNDANYSFRPLDGESISKPEEVIKMAEEYSFRPLDGESISKRHNYFHSYQIYFVSVP